ncbi:MAG: Polysaccharide biosynthesis/export protein [Gemmataceae bacterium]|nr:Polysaccharide biosynthesis/export protein [Gemmataceae bacterium]
MLFATLFLAGCTDARFLHRTCPQPPNPAAAATTPAPDVRYRVGCPDVLEVSFADRPEWDALVSIDLDGRVPLEEPGSPRVEGMTLDEVRDELARLAGVSGAQVRVTLASARSGFVFLHGPVRGRTRVVPYQGPEPVIDFLKRVGGLPPGSKLNQVYVVRPHVAAGERPEVFRVNVPAVLLDNDPATNIPLRPSDQVYVGETRGSSFSRVLPHWLGAAYRRFTGLLPDEWWPFNWSSSRGP